MSGDINNLDLRLKRSQLLLRVYDEPQWKGPWGTIKIQMHFALSTTIEEAALQKLLNINCCD